MKFMVSFLGKELNGLILLAFILSSLLSVALYFGADAYSFSYHSHGFIYVLTTLCLSRLIERYVLEREGGDVLRSLAIGNVLLPVIVLPLTFLLHVEIRIIVYFVFCLVVGLTLLNKKAETCETEGWVPLVGLFVFLAVALVIDGNTLQPMQITEKDVVFSEWLDHFIHLPTAMMIDGANQVFGRYEAAGEGISFYHFAIYVFSSYLLSVSPASGLETFLPPFVTFGFLVCMCAVYTCVSYLWGRNVALFVSALLFLIPDSSHHFAPNPMFGFVWLLKISPGCLWGGAVFMLCLRFILEWLDTKNLKPFIFALFFLIIMPLFRAQFFPLVFFIIGVMAITGFPKGNIWQKAGAVGLFCGSIFFGLKLLEPFVKNPTLFGPTGVERVTQDLAGRFVSDNTLGLIFTPLKRAFPSLDLGINTLSLLLMVTGVSIFLYALILCFGGAELRRRFRLWIALFVLGSYTLSLFFFPINRGGNPFELQHRPFTLVYAVLTVFVVSVLVHHVMARWGMRRSVVALSVVSAFLAVMHLSEFVTPDHKKKHMIGFFQTRYDAGLYNAARYIRENKQGSEERFLDTGLDPSNFVIAVSETRSMVSRAVRHSIKYREKRKKLYAELQEAAKQIFAAHDVNKAREIAATYKVRWVLKRPNDPLAWQGQLQESYHSQGYMLFDLGPLTREG